MTPIITWTASEVAMPALPFALLEQWIVQVAERHSRVVGVLSYEFCNDEHILDVNRQFLNHDYFTDIITFDDCCGRLLRGDMVISLETVASNAAELGLDYEQELLRVIIHGVLHLCGINDKGPGEREIMEREENKALELFHNICAQKPRTE